MASHYNYYFTLGFSGIVQLVSLFIFTATVIAHESTVAT